MIRDRSNGQRAIADACANEITQWWEQGLFYTGAYRGPELVV